MGEKMRLAAALLTVMLLARAPMDSQLKRVQANGAELPYVERGRGEPVVLIHGSLVDYREFAGQMDALARKYRVIAYSRRYHWPNDAAAAGPDYSEQLHADDLVALITGLKLGGVHLVGHSYGGAVAALVARDHPELLRSVTLGEPGIFVLLPQDDATAAFFQELRGIRPQLMDAIARGDKLGSMKPLMDYLLRPGKFDDLAEHTRTEMLQNAGSWERQLNSRAAPMTFTCEDAKKIAAPTLLLVGQNTAPEFTRVAMEMAKCLPKVKVQIVAGSGHGLFFDRPAAVNTVLLDFLAANSGSRSP